MESFCNARWRPSLIAATILTFLCVGSVDASWWSFFAGNRAPAHPAPFHSHGEVSFVETEAESHEMRPYDLRDWVLVTTTQPPPTRAPQPETTTQPPITQDLGEKKIADDKPTNIELPPNLKAKSKEDVTGVVMTDKETGQTTVLRPPDEFTVNDEGQLVISQPNDRLPGGDYDVAVEVKPPEEAARGPPREESLGKHPLEADKPSKVPLPPELKDTRPEDVTEVTLEDKDGNKITLSPDDFEVTDEGEVLIKPNDNVPKGDYDVKVGLRPKPAAPPPKEEDLGRHPVDNTKPAEVPLPPELTGRPPEDFTGVTLEDDQGNKITLTPPDEVEVTEDGKIVIKANDKVPSGDYDVKMGVKPPKPTEAGAQPPPAAPPPSEEDLGRHPVDNTKPAEVPLPPELTGRPPEDFTGVTLEDDQGNKITLTPPDEVEVTEDGKIVIKPNDKVPSGDYDVKVEVKPPKTAEAGTQPPPQGPREEDMGDHLLSKYTAVTLPLPAHLKDIPPEHITGILLTDIETGDTYVLRPPAEFKVTPDGLVVQPNDKLPSGRVSVKLEILPPEVRARTEAPYAFKELEKWKPTRTACWDASGVQFPIEVGRMVTHTRNWLTVKTNSYFSDPVVIGGVPDMRGGQEAVVRLQNVRSGAFEMRLDEPFPCRDQWHIRTPIDWLVVESGVHRHLATTMPTLPEGITVAAGKVLAGNRKWTYVTFPIEAAFTEPPIVVVQVQTDNSGRRFVHPRVSEKHRIGTRGFHGVRVNHRLYRISYGGNIANNRVFMSIITFRGGDACQLRIKNRGSDYARIFVQEERCSDREMWHTRESVSWLPGEEDEEAVASAPHLTQVLLSWTGGEFKANWEIQLTVEPESPIGRLEIAQGSPNPALAAESFANVVSLQEAADNPEQALLETMGYDTVGGPPPKELPRLGMRALTDDDIQRIGKTFHEKPGDPFTLLRTVSCGPPPVPVNGTVDYDGITSGSQATFRCTAPGTSWPKGAPDRTLCREDGRWQFYPTQKEVPSCIIVQKPCRMPEYPYVSVGESIPRLIFSDPFFEPGDEIQFECPNNTALVGDKKISCSGDTGTFRGKFPVCKGICPMDEIESTKHMTFRVAHRPVVTGTKVYLQCPGGLKVEPHLSAVLTCIGVAPPKSEEQETMKGLLDVLMGLYSGMGCR
ncbi:unnamed protein product [Vitrella brassicaformis CCMP3155]|uniref:Sushi domain-containing protein n=1 Tax=Vitrella brassicaformis (strain CCMP3155) TaxID=1169540 RepID=A0A0G4FNS9_VITBC|nr:unnamed protein product [Vitrella brassicaformis CCMP3155]|eukprot:CEM15884.1 unnamed protein product [Vitrella brassicaformis CCMP3155]